VSAKDKASGKENKITIKANSGLSEEEIDRMVKDAEANAAEDHKLRELIDSRNSGEALVHSTQKALTEYGDKVDADTKGKIETALKDLEDVLKGSDKAAIDEKVAALSLASQQLGEKMYADAQAAGAPGAEAAGGAHAGSSSKPEDDVVDADFKEVKKD
jgi:molecular chaperone DnaK